MATSEFSEGKEEIMHDHIPAQLETETASAYAAFCDFCLLGPGRGLKQLIKTYQKSTGIVPTTSIRTVKGWSSGNNWFNRAAVYDRNVANGVTAEYIMGQTEWVRTELKGALALYDGFMAKVKAMETAGWHGVKPRDFDDLGRTHDNLTRQIRRALEMPDKYTHTTAETDGDLTIRIVREDLDGSGEDD